MLNYSYNIKSSSLLGWQIADRPKKNTRESRLKYHIKTNDYFGTLATVLDLMDQFSRNHIDRLMKVEMERLGKIKAIKEDLLLLQNEYKIVKKKRNENK